MKFNYHFENDAVISYDEISELFKYEDFAGVLVVMYQKTLQNRRNDRIILIDDEQMVNPQELNMDQSMIRFLYIGDNTEAKPIQKQNEECFRCNFTIFRWNYDTESQ